jgi:hypothetical protein
MRAAPALAATGLVALGACASARTITDVDAGDGDGGPELDAAADAADPDAAIDAAAIDARPDAPPIDAPPIDAPPIDAPTDAPIDAPMCTPTWHDLLGNGGFDTGIVPWTQTSMIILPAANLPFAPHAGTHAARFGGSHNANDVLVQNVTIPAGATGLRVRGYQCFVTEDPISDADSFEVTLETPAGNVLDTLLSITNSDTAPICFWQSFTWVASSPHAGQAIVLRLRGRTNLAFLTRFIVDTMALEWLGC